MQTGIRLITRSFTLATLLSLAPVGFGETAPTGSDKHIVRSEACAEGEDCCYELFSFCDGKPNMTPCSWFNGGGG